MFALSNGLAKFQCSISTETVEVYSSFESFARGMDLVILEFFGYEFMMQRVLECYAEKSKPLF